MSVVPREVSTPGPGEISPEVLRGARPRTTRRIIRGLIWTGIALLGIGFGVAFLAQGASVPATVLLSLGLVVEAAGLVGYRVLFWVAVYSKDRPTKARHVRKSGP